MEVEESEGGNSLQGCFERVIASSVAGLIECAVGVLPLYMLARLLRPAFRLCRPFSALTPKPLTQPLAPDTRRKRQSVEEGKSHDFGIYHCAVCNEGLFPSIWKFSTDSEHASFSASNPKKVKIVNSDKKEKEVLCAKVRTRQCSSRLGLVFKEERPPTDKHFQITVSALKFEATPSFPPPLTKNAKRRQRTKPQPSS